MHLEINTNMSSVELLNTLLSKSQNYIHNVLSSIYCLEDNHKLYVTEAPVIKMTLLKCLIQRSLQVVKNPVVFKWLRYANTTLSRKYTKHGPGSMDHLMDPIHLPSPWTTPYFHKEIAPVNMRICQSSGYEKHRLIFFH